MDTGTLLGIFVGSFLGIMVTAWVFSWFFTPKKNTRLLELQVNLLVRMAERSGMPNDEIDFLVNKAYRDGNSAEIVRLIRKDT